MTGDEFNKMMHEHAKQVLGTGKKQQPAGSDPVNHPHHYEYAGFQVIDIIEAVLPADWSKGFILGNVIKYILRSFRKNGSEDLRKAKWYLDRLVSQLDREK